MLTRTTELLKATSLSAQVNYPTHSLLFFEAYGFITKGWAEHGFKIPVDGSRRRFVVLSRSIIPPSYLHGPSQRIRPPSLPPHQSSTASGRCP